MVNVKGETESSETSCIVTDAKNGRSVAEGSNTTASSFASHAEGIGTIASGRASHAEGNGSTASGRYSHAEGFDTTASEICSHAEGHDTKASGNTSHAEGVRTTATGSTSHAEGFRTTASGFVSHAEGLITTASGEVSHAEGDSTTARGMRSHAEGSGTMASGEASHAEGFRTTASSFVSHAEGLITTAIGVASHAEGLVTSTNSLTGAHIMGQFGNADEEFSWHLANGTPSSFGLATRIDGSLAKGIATFGWVSGSADYAEMFETLDGNPIDVGYFVTLVGDKVRKANLQDTYILGITSATPAFLGGDPELEWKDKWVKDEWGRWVFQESTAPPVTDQEGRVLAPERTGMQKIVKPEYDNTKQYIPRSKRPEWVAVGLLGQLLVRDDGTCKPDGYCRPNDDGIATVVDMGYRVMKRTGPSQVLVLVK